MKVVTRQSMELSDGPGLTDKIAVVTSASRGIGLGIARTLATEGATAIGPLQ